MIILLSLVVSAAFAVWAGKPLRKHPVPFYAGFAVIAAASVLAVWSGLRFPAVISEWVLPMFARGGLSGALFILVMWAGAFPNASKPIKLLFPIRGQLSILASILTIGHNIAYGRTYFVRLFASAASLPSATRAAAVCSLVMILIMLPLFITSFPSVRKKMRPKSWKRLQRSAYGFYGLLYCHIMLLTMPNALAGRAESLLSAFVYSAIFVSYAACRILKALDKGKNAAGLARKQVRAAGICLLLAAAVIAIPAFQNDRQRAAESADKPTADIENAQTPDPQTGDAQTIDAKSDDTQTNDTPTMMPEGTEDPVLDSGVLRDGVYTGSGMGMNAEITVEVTILNGEIADISVVSSRDDAPYYSDALAVIDDILSAQSIEVDTVSGATYSSGGILDAVEDALKGAASP